MLNKINHNWIKFFFLLIGIVLLGILTQKIGWDHIWNYLNNIGWAFLNVLLITLFTYFILAIAWHLCTHFLKVNIQTSHLFKYKIIGEAINTVTPLSWGGGDVARIFYLKEHMTVAQASASVLIDRVFYIYSIAIFMFFGTVELLYLFQFPTTTKLYFIGFLLMVVATAVFFYRRAHEGFLSFGIDLLKKLKIKKHFKPNTLEKAVEIDQLIAHFNKEYRLGFYLALSIHCLSRFMGVIEIYYIAYATQSPITWTLAYLLASVTILINFVFAFIPGSLGALEGGYAGFFALLGLSPASGTALQIIRRIRAIAFTIVGYILIAMTRKK